MSNWFSSNIKIGDNTFSRVTREELTKRMDSLLQENKPVINKDYYVALKEGENTKKTVEGLVIEVYSGFMGMGETKIKLWIQNVTQLGGEITKDKLLEKYNVLKLLSKGGKSRKQKRGGRKSRKNRRSRKSM
jgi:hypothetical protein